MNGSAAMGGSNRWLRSSVYSSSPQQGENLRTMRSSREPSRAPTPSSSQRWNVEDLSLGELSPGILDLQSFDTELLPEMSIPGSYDSYGRGQNFSDLEPSIFTNKQMTKSFSADKEKASSVAKIKVVVRKRPLNKKELSKKEEDIITIEPSSNSLTVHETKLKVDLTEYVEKHEFIFNAVLDEDVSNDEVYRETVEPIVPAIFQRTKATCFAYGQTGNGKTYTMQPLPLKASQDILRLMHHTYKNQGFQLFVSFFEIYGGKLFDLLNEKRKLCMREDGKQQVCIVGLQEFRVSNVDIIRELIEKGNASRSTGTTGANEESSRSHAILQLAIKKLVEGNESKPARVVGKLSFIDLAGSERGADTTDNDKQTRIEGAEINKSLLALKECIRALDSDQVHIPFRGSKLTEVLRDSFIGDSRTVMISCISPNSGSCEHTLNTLRYADRVKSLSRGSSKKDLFSASFNRESNPAPLSSVSPFLSFDGNNVGFACESQRFGRPKQIEKETSLPFNINRVSSGREELRVPPPYPTYFKQQTRGVSGMDVSNFSQWEYEQDKPSRQKGAGNSFSASPIDDRGRSVSSQMQWNDLSSAHVNGSNSDDDLNALLQEEEDLVMAHREQVEETINIVREEMKLLEEADQPGNQLDNYIIRLNTILSQKAAGIMNLQSRLTQFQRRLAEHNVLVSSMAV
ncbi:kinesin-like protein KIN-13B [Typha angustifolia]|uniref:kinesin-like protein KIN-13B n=1 Tax=Typha angustifolia TaxID=59011 RepID=UPI003C2C16FE